LDDPAREDPASWKRIYSFLRRGYWHATSPDAWKAIKKSGAIKRNIGSRYPTQFELSYAYIHEKVALFDFVSPTEEDLIQSWQHAMDFLTIRDILIRLDARRLRRKVIPNRIGYEPENGIVNYDLCIPHCEVWYPEDIPITAIRKVYRLPHSSQSAVLTGIEAIQRLLPNATPEIGGHPIDWEDLCTPSDDLPDPIGDRLREVEQQLQERQDKGEP
jgi:hypothetical protein